jgi:hypothetical protein
MHVYQKSEMFLAFPINILPPPSTELLEGMGQQATGGQCIIGAQANFKASKQLQVRPRPWMLLFFLRNL